MFGIVAAAFVGGMIFLASMYFIFRLCLERAMRKVRAENQRLRQELARVKEDYAALEASWNCAQAKAQGKEIGLNMRDAERFVQKFGGPNMKFRDTSVPKKKQGGGAA